MQLARYGLPLTLGGLSVALYSTSDRLIVAYLLGKDAAGIFGVAADLPRQFMVMLASSVAAATVPVVFRAFLVKAVTPPRANGSTTALNFYRRRAADRGLAGARRRPGRRNARRRRIPRRRVRVAAAAGAGAAVRHRQSVLCPAQLSACRASIPAGRAVVPHACPEHRADGRARRRLRAARRRAGHALATEAIGLVAALVLMRRAHVLPFDLNRPRLRLRRCRIMAAAIPAARSPVAGTGLVALIVVSMAGGIAYAAAAFLLNIANVRTLSGRLLRSLNRKALGV